MNNTIKERRLELGLTQAQLAQAAGINLRQIQKIESGEIRLDNITLANAARLAAALGCSIEELLEEAAAK